ncbi:hypothetical protein ABBQ32_002413 [Trebouxia sp. C0010 RCD-2024]
MSDAEAIDWVVGCNVTVQTKNEEVQGEVFAYDKGSNTVLIRQQGSTPFHSNLRLLKASYIKNVNNVLPPAQPVEPLPLVDMQRCRDRESKALQAAQAEAAKTGIGVSTEAQQVFDALSKTMPCHWRQQSIIILNEVELQPPYGLSNCSTENPSDLATLERVKKVLTAERQRLGLV